MDRQQTGMVEEPLSETPEDVAILYSWANLHGAKYRDFSASRREYRAQIRHRAAEDFRRAQLQAKYAAEAAAAEAERVARAAERAAHGPDTEFGRMDRERALYDAEGAARVAAAERFEAARRAEAAAMADAAARREEREIAEAHLSAERQTASWNEAEMRRLELAGPQPVPQESEFEGQHFHYQYQNGARQFDPTSEPARWSSPNRALAYTQPKRFRDESLEYAPRVSSEPRVYREKLEVHRRPRGFRPDLESGLRTAYRPDEANAVFSGQQDAFSAAVDAGAVYPERLYGGASPQGSMTSAQPVRAGGERIVSPAAVALAGGVAVPAAVVLPGAVADTLQYSRERVAARWFALKGLFEPGQQVPIEPEKILSNEVQVPMLTIFSLAGGRGKTSLLATLGRALSASGEKVLLADTTPHGLLPYYFGASELKAGVVRTFSPPTGSADAPIHLVSYAVDACADGPAQQMLAAELMRNSSGTDRLMLDLDSAAPWLLQRMASFQPAILVPLVPDMNSVISLQAFEQRMSRILDRDGKGIAPWYVLNQFDASQPLHLDVREVLQRQLGDRLLPGIIRSSPMVAEALAEGMTVIDYAPDSGVAGDYRAVAGWLRSMAAAPRLQVRNSRWSER